MVPVKFLKVINLAIPTFSQTNKKTLWWSLLFLLKWTFMQILCQFLHEKKRLHNCFVILFRFSTFSKCLSYFLWVNFEILFCLYLMYVIFFKIYILVVLFLNLLLFHDLKQKIEEEKNRKTEKIKKPLYQIVAKYLNNEYF